MMPMAKGATVYDFVFDSVKDSWVTWEGHISADPLPADATFRKIIIPTVDTVRYVAVHMSQSHIDHKTSPLLVRSIRPPIHPFMF